MAAREARAVRVSPYRFAAILAWLLGVSFTSLFVAELIPERHWTFRYLVAAIFQAILTLAQRPLWRALFKRSGGEWASLAFVATAIDGGLNAAGLYRQIGRLSNTSLATMISEVFGVANTMSRNSAAIISFIIGVFFAGLPEYLWQLAERDNND